MFSYDFYESDGELWTKGTGFPVELFGEKNVIASCTILLKGFPLNNSSLSREELIDWLSVSA